MFIQNHPNNGTDLGADLGTRTWLVETRFVETRSRHRSCTELVEVLRYQNSHVALAVPSRQRQSHERLSLWYSRLHTPSIYNIHPRIQEERSSQPEMLESSITSSRPRVCSPLPKPDEGRSIAPETAAKPPYVRSLTFGETGVRLRYPPAFWITRAEESRRGRGIDVVFSQRNVTTFEDEVVPRYRNRQECRTRGSLSHAKMGLWETSCWQPIRIL